MPPLHDPVSFVKMHGVGNDFVVIDLVAAVPVEPHQHGDVSQYHVDNTARTALSRFLHQHLLQSPFTWEFPKGFIRQIASRELGVGCDQVVVLCEGNVNGPDGTVSVSSTAALAHINTCRPVSLASRLWCSARIFNGNDGAEVEMCGNAVRCIAWYWALQHAIRTPSSGAAGCPNGSGHTEIIDVFLPASKRCMPCTVSMDSAAVRSCLAARSPHPPPSSLLSYVLAATGIATANVVVQFGCTDVVWSGGLDADEEMQQRCGAVDVGVETMVAFVATKDPILAQLLADHTDAVYAVKVGNPHCVLVAKANDGTNEALLSEAVVESTGRCLNQWRQRFPQGVNVEFAALRPLEVGEREQGIQMRVFERGAGITKACGSGACATAVAAHAHLRGAPCSTLTSRVEMDGGELVVDTTPCDDSRFAEIQVTGAAAFTFCGEWLPLV